uniref:Uncharacterized protein n=2 Tax=unclassified Caudoviricetes TaxID=2788787 RepID=A0A8S5SBJ2_9CAUD|nr:MAG TPA: hypothetical protein [Siphoviridae sp. ctHhH6]DAF48302.1 MAG TPA: hypothetical protein [Siphoviridae sp. ct4Z13]DAK81664.1 MAG TPA: hypothetical protein [Caudoviricetes sp.]
MIKLYTFSLAYVKSKQIQANVSKNSALIDVLFCLEKYFINTYIWKFLFKLQ